jgi:ferric-dicitrate binding protein FerR (iron transport regulator)
MSSSVSGEPVIPRADEQRRRGRRVALLILALCAAPTAAAWLAFFVWPPQSRTNYGELIEPRPLSDPEMRRLDGNAFRLSQLRGRWVLLQVDSGSCGEACRRNLVYMRQARLALGKDAERIERVWLLDDAADPAPALLREHEGLNVARAVGAPILAELPAPRSPAGYIYVVDPLGTLMLRFPGEPDARRMLKDLVRLLKASRIG